MKKDVKMIASIRTSKRIALGALVGFCLLCFGLLAVKDMNDKLGVMTASNAGYQKMTDTQADKIKSLTTELEALRASKVSELRSAEEEKRDVQDKLDDVNRKFAQLKKEFQSQIDDLNEAKGHLESERDELKRLNGRQKQEADQFSIQLRDQIARMSLEKDACQKQYDALFKLHQEASDQLANLANKPKQELLPSSSTKSNRQQLQIPGNKQQLQLQQSFVKDVSQARSSSSQPVGLEEPRVVQLPQQVGALSTAKGGLAPVGAQPPLGNLEVVPFHQLHKEDVMEAPKPHQAHFENMDAQVDPIQHDHPGLQAPVYRDNHNVALDEDDLEDAADGQIPNDYSNDKVVFVDIEPVFFVIIIIFGILGRQSEV